jgi:SrtB family sortase
MSAVLFAVGLFLTVFAARELLINLQDDAASQAEYDHLREMIADTITAMPLTQLYESIEQTGQNSLTSTTAEQEISCLEPNEPINADTDSTLNLLRIFSEINPDFVGWMVIPGTAIDYPIVRGTDNSLYLHTTFSGTQNPAGTIFMDYRCTEGFATPISLIYGHNMRNGSMFSPLTNYTNQDFMNNNSEIIILTADGHKLVYRIFDTKHTDAWDSVYELDFNDAANEFFPASDAQRFLILSTCLNSADRNARLLVFAAQNE